MKKHYFKVQYGYNHNDYLPIEEHELDKAMLAHLTGAVVALENGSVTGSKIIVIKEDFIKAMGWNRGYNPSPEDQAEIELKCKDYRGLIATSEERVAHLIRTNQTHLVGKKIDMPNAIEDTSEISGKHHEISTGVKQLVHKTQL